MSVAFQNDSWTHASEGGAGARLRLRLYVAGQAPNSAAAAATLRTLVAEFSTREIELETIDVFQEPERARRDGALATPMLIKLAPLPERRILGGLSDREGLLLVLGLEESAP